jgi:NDP-sugar pyrophosphorylase family protein
MQAVILAAGRGTRMGALTETTPKPLLEVAHKSLLEHKFESLPEEVDEIIIVVGYLGSHIQNHFGGNYNGKRILYVEQEVLDGTMGALARAKDILHDRFIVMMGDDLYAENDIAQCAALTDWSMLVQASEQMKSGGRVVIDDQGLIVAIEEGDHKGEMGFASTGLFVLDTRLFAYPMIPKAVGSTEYGLPQTVLAASRASGISFVALEATFWFQVSVPEDLARAEAALEARG